MCALELAIVVVSLDTLGTLVQPVVVEFFLGELMPETCLQSTAEWSELQLEVCCRGPSLICVRCHQAKLFKL